MKVKSSKNRLLQSIAFSLLVHVFVLEGANLLLQFQAQKPQVAKIEILDVWLAHATPPKTPPQAIKKLLTSKASAQFKVSQSNPQNPPPQITQPPAAESGEISGIGFPGAVTTPFQGNPNLNQSLLHSRISQRQAEQIYYQQALEAQEKQRTEYQAQIIIQQLHQLLTQQLHVEPAVTGTCKLVEYNAGKSHKLSCGNSALYEVLYKDQNAITSMFIALRGLGHVYNGFSVEMNNDKLQIKLLP